VAIETTEFSRDWRKRHIAHHDLALATNEKAQALKTATLEQVNAALKAIADVLNVADHHFTNSETYFNIGHGPSGAVSLTQALENAEPGGQSGRERLMRGK
jgi:N-acetylmuramic acid 6-phosphate (MurNAc-6-P) etherase